MYAIVKTGGKQYKVAVGDVIEVEKIEAEDNSSIALDVVFIVDGSTITADSEALGKAKVFATVVEQFKGEKKIIFKFKKRKGYKRLRGHRQNLTKLLIESISLDGKAPKVESKKEEAKDADEKPAKKRAAKKTEEVAAATEAVVETEAPVSAAQKKAAAKKALAEKAETEVAEETAAEEVVEEKPKPKRTRTPKAKVEETPAEEAEEKTEE